jgi:hypothetical protein
MNSTRRTSERAHGQIELDLELRDSSELDAQPTFSIVKALAYGPERSREAAPNHASSRVW